MYKEMKKTLMITAFISIFVLCILIILIGNHTFNLIEDHYRDSKISQVNYFFDQNEKDLERIAITNAVWTDSLEALANGNDEWLTDNATEYVVFCLLYTSIVDIGRWVLEEACIFSKKINQRLDESIVVAINISSVQMLHPDFIRELELIIEKTNVNPNNLCLEMTETTLFEFPEGNEHIITKIKSMGLEIALDDFGTGYSSLSYFKDIPASTIKIDKVFIDNMVNNEFDNYTVKMIIDLAHHKNLSVIAEGVEEEEQSELLKNMSCDIIQGYYYSKPLMASEVMELLLNQG